MDLKKNTYSELSSIKQCAEFLIRKYKEELISYPNNFELIDKLKKANTVWYSVVNELEKRLIYENDI